MAKSSAIRSALTTLLLVFAARDSFAEDQHAEYRVRRERGKVFAEREGRQLLADIYQPVAEGTFPGVLMIHGGGWMSGNRWNMLMHANALARAGYVVVNIEYRLAPRFKHPAQLDDCLDAYRWMCAHADELHINPQQLAIYGYSAGAHLSCLVGLDFPEEPELAEPKAIVAGGTPADFEWIAENSRALAYFLGGSRAQLPEVYRDASPITHVSPDDPPVFLFHGDQDNLVPLESVERFYQRLQENQVRCELLKVSDKGHIATFLDTAPTERAVAFLDSIFRSQDQQNGQKKEVTRPSSTDAGAAERPSRNRSPKKSNPGKDNGP